METKILEELIQIRYILSKITGTTDLADTEKFSVEALDKAAKEYQSLLIKRGEWIEDSEISSVIKNAPWKSGQFIVEKFGFNNYFKRGRTLYFNKKDLIELRNELKERKVNLERYMELVDDKAKFEGYIKNINLPKGKKKAKPYRIPEDIQDIETQPYLIPEEVIKRDISELKKEYNTKKLVQYIDLYEKGTHAMYKQQYWFEKYLEPGTKKECKSWIERFNYANYAMKNLRELQKGEQTEA